jgi:quercetin dioxygenase-like cupin family protein
MAQRVFENPLIDDKVTLLETSNETNGAYTLVEVELPAGGGNELHFHNKYSTEFIPVEGELEIDLEKRKLRIEPGKKMTLRKGKPHRFYNPGYQPIRFRMKFVPGHEGFENSLRISYGLAEDHKTTNTGDPKDLTHLSLLTYFSGSSLAGAFSPIQRFLEWEAKRAINNGMDKQLIAQYC